jgi:hypothetical protein
MDSTVAMARFLAAWLIPLALASASWADEVALPLAVDYEILGMALDKQLADRRGGLELWRSPDGCGSFVLRAAAVQPAEDGRLRIAGPASASAGLPFLGLCWANVSWSGRVDIVASPEMGADWQLRLRDLETRLYDASGGKAAVADRLWSVINGWGEAELSAFTFDLGPPVSELTALLATFSGPPGTTPLARALTTVRPAGVSVERSAVRVLVALDLPPGHAAPRVPEPALTPAQLRRWEAHLEEWDGFLSFIVKSLAGDNADPAVRDELLGLLLEARRQLVAALGRGPAPGTDAVRSIFVDTWDRLRAIVRHTALQQQGDPARAWRYVVFLAAGDALATIDAVAPAAGLDFSSDGLRRLARSLDPGFAGDPLEHSDRADPQLQELFRFRDPDAPPRRRRTKLPGTSWHWLGPRHAHAAGSDDEWRAVAARLDRWVPADGELTDYRLTLDRLLTMVAERTIDPDALEERFDQLFTHLVKATAWQESCWRQFVRRGGRVTYLGSATGDVGLMQVNARIWRGFFSGAKLRWNAAYNAGAGAEILHQLLVRYGTREASIRLENAARATYSAYHGGPARYTRYRSARVASLGRAIDHAFWEKYRAVATHTADDRVLCLRRPSTS